MSGLCVCAHFRVFIGGGAGVVICSLFFERIEADCFWEETEISFLLR